MQLLHPVQQTLASICVFRVPLEKIHIDRFKLPYLHWEDHQSSLNRQELVLETKETRRGTARGRFQKSK